MREKVTHVHACVIVVSKKNTRTIEEISWQEMSAYHNQISSAQKLKWWQWYGDDSLLLWLFSQTEAKI